MRCYSVTPVRGVGRFTQTDPIRGNRPTDHYAYGFNNPVTTTDPMGLYGWTLPREYASDPEFRKGFHGGSIPTLSIPLPPRVSGAIKVVAGTLGAMGSTAALAAPEPTFTKVLGAVGFGYSADLAATGLRELWTGEYQKTVTNVAVRTVAEPVVGPENAQLVADSVEGAVSGVVASLPGMAGRVATVELRGLSAEAQRGIRSYDKRIAKHEAKLAEFKANPTVKPGMEKLSPDKISKQQQTRIKHLEDEIRAFKDNQEKLRQGERP